MIWFLEMMLFVWMGTVLGWLGNDLWRSWRVRGEDDYVAIGNAGNPVTAAELEEESKPLPEFPVTGKPRRVPWRVRKAEIEAQHRTKRRATESWEV